MFNGIILNTGTVKIVKNNKKSKLIGIKSTLKFKKKTLDHQFAVMEYA